MKSRLPSILFAVVTLAMITPSLRSLDASQIPRIEALFKDYDRADAPGASVMVVHRGKAIFTRGYGLADRETRTPCTTNTNFRLASVSKQFTAMAVLMLAEHGKLRLDETLLDFFPGFPSYGRQITVKHLLTHTSGLADYEDLIPAGTTLPVLDQDVLRLLLDFTGDAAPSGIVNVAWTEDARENAKRLKRELDGRAGDAAATSRRTTLFPPGTQFRYSNTGFSLLALIVEARSGQRFARFLKDNIFDPLQMTNTLAFERGISEVPQRAYGYSPVDRGWRRTDQSLTSSVLGDGGIYSSVADLFKWDQALYKSRLVSARRLREAFTAQTPAGQLGRSYGFGWFIGEYRGLQEIWHSGDTIGFRTRITRIPGKQFSVIILANRADAKLEELSHRIADIVLFDGK